MKTTSTPRNYGAAEMKSFYVKNLRKGLEFAIIIHIALISMYFAFNYGSKLSADNNIKPPIIINIEPIGEPPSTDETEELTIPKTKDITEPLKDMGAMIPEPVAHDKAELMTIKTQNQLDSIKGNVSNRGDSVQWVDNRNNGKTVDIDKTIDIKIHKQPNIDTEIKNYNPADVESIPECVNFDQVKASIEYPMIAKEIGLEGKVNVKVLVDANGKVVKIGTITGPDAFYDEVKQKVKNLEFTPGLLNNKPVNVWVNVPFTFKLKN